MALRSSKPIRCVLTAQFTGLLLAIGWVFFTSLSFLLSIDTTMMALTWTWNNEPILKPARKFLIGCSPEEFDHFTPLDYHYSFQELKQHYGWEYFFEVFNQASANQTSADALIQLNPQVLLFCREHAMDMDHWPIAALREQGTTIALFMDDLQLFKYKDFGPRTVRNVLNQTDVLIGPYAYRAANYYQNYFGSEMPELYMMPHSASPSFLVSVFNTTPQEDLLLSGAVDQHYPVRMWLLKKYLPENEDKLTYYGHPGYDKRDPTLMSRYAEVIGSHLGAFSSTSLYRRAVSKTFEIPATGALLLTNLDIEELFERLGFINGVHYVGFDSNNPSPTIDWVLDPRNRVQVDEIRRQGMELVHSHHTFRNRARDLDEFFRTGTHKYSAAPLNKTDPCPMVTFKTRKECVTHYFAMYDKLNLGPPKKQSRQRPTRRNPERKDAPPVTMNLTHRRRNPA